MPDRGPIYTETVLYEQAGSTGLIVEPFNAASAVLFVVIAVFWLRRAVVQRESFFIYAAVVLLLGGVGGTLYHATRSHVAYLILDVAPIFLLALSAVYWFVRKMTVASWVAPAYTLGGLVVITLLIQLLRGAMHGTPRGPIVGYGMLGVFVTVPMLTFVVRTRFRHAWWVASALTCFVIGMTFRALDRSGWLPMGTHFLWHSFGAAMTHLLIAYLWRVRDLEPVR